MKNLSDTLIKTQKQASHIPYVELEAVNRINGVTKLHWQRLYSGTEEEYFHAVTLAADGSLIRARITPTSDSRKLYVQRIVNPGEDSAFGSWHYTGQYNAVIVAAASLGATVSIFWIKSDRKIQCIISNDYGATWSDAQLVDYSPTTAINGISASYKPNGDLALFFADQSALYVKKLVNGQWQAKSAWDKTTGNLSGVSAVYDNDWNLFVTGKDSNGNFRLWSIVYGDGGNIPAGSWGELQTLAEAPSDGNFSYHHAFLDKPDAFRCFYIEKYGGNETYSQPFSTHTIGNFADNLWLEPQPFNLSSEYGLAIAHNENYCWLSCANSVWRAPLSEQRFDITNDILSLKQETIGFESRLTVELVKDDTKHSSLPPPLDIGCRLNFNPGYITENGCEVCGGQSYTLQAYEYINSKGSAKLVLYAVNGWDNLNRWTARQQYCWNRDSEDMSVKDILAFILARAGLKLEVISASDAIGSFYPDFNINPGTKGDSIVKKLLSFVPDLLFIEGYTARLVNPLPDDNPVYSYSAPQIDGMHPILAGRYRTEASDYNHIRVEGLDDINNQALILNCYEYADIENSYARFLSVEDVNIGSIDAARSRGEAILRRYEIENLTGYIEIHPNCGQQLYDVIDITDSKAGLVNEKRRITGLKTLFLPACGKYLQTLLLGKV
ncbi:MAG: hypothetical protein PHF74_04910 [Dehalococcoidales bacterium]|nr:hypothetical protein [Dehalococcoidales bacterium]